MTARSAVLLGLRYFYGRRDGRPVRTLRGAVLGIGLSLVPLVVVLVVSDGMIEGITARYIEISTYHLQAVAFTDKFPAGDVEAFAERLRAVPGVRGVYPERQGLGLVSSKNGRSGATIRAVPGDMYESDERMREYLRFVDGTFDLSVPSNILLGRGIAEQLGVTTGDQVTLVTVRSLPGRPSLPRLEPFRVTGVFTTGYQELDSLWAYIPFERGQRSLDTGTSQLILGIKIDEPFGDLTTLVTAVDATLPVDFRAYTWYDLEKSQYMSFQTTRVLLLFIMGLIVCVAAVTISSSLVTLVIEKRQEIGILKSIGAGPGGIELTFITAGFLVGVMGTALGMTFGLLAAVNINEIIRFIETMVNGVSFIIRSTLSPIFAVGDTEIRILNPAYYLETIPIRLDVIGLLVISCFSVLLSTMAAFLPARSAGKIRPLDVLRKH